MKTAVLMVLLLAVFIYGAIAETAPPASKQGLPVLPANGKTVDDFVPKGWRMIKKVEGDLNLDRIPDFVGVIQRKQKSKGPDDAPPRILFILFNKGKNGPYELSLQSGKAIMKRNEGGIMGDPFQGLYYDRGTFIILFYGGSRIRWEYSARFRYQDRGWFLIGFTKTITDSGSGQGETKDYNLLTGKYIITKKSHETTISSVVRKRQRRKLVNLEDFVASGIEQLNY